MCDCDKGNQPMSFGLAGTTGEEIVNSGGWGSGLSGLGLGDASVSFPYYVPPAANPSPAVNWNTVFQNAFTSGVNLATNVFSEKPAFTQQGPQGTTQVWGSTYPGGFSTLPGGGFSTPSTGTLLVIGAVAVGILALMSKAIKD